MTNFINKSLIAIFIAIMAISALLLYNGYIGVRNTHAQAKAIIDVQYSKHSLLTTMYSAARERSLILFAMLSQSDPFELDDLNQNFGEQARVFIKARQDLVALKLTEQEQSLLAEQSQATAVNAQFQNEVAELFLEDKREQAKDLLLNTAIPGQNIVLQKLNDVIELYEQNMISSVSRIDENYEKASHDFQILGITLLGSCALFALFAMHVSRREREKLEVLLTEQKKISRQLDNSAERLSYQASHDGLTGLINRQEFEIRLMQLLKRAKEGKTHVVFYLDLDQFKIVNDTCGHHAGDALLKEVAVLMQSFIRKSDVLARLGGDEFGIILEYCDLPLAENIAQSIIQAVNEFRFRWERKTFRIGVSIGMSLINDSNSHPSDILKQIDSACYAAKDAGRNRYHLYIEGDKDLVRRESEMDWVRRLEHALEENRFVLYAQPIVPIGERCAISKNNYEILIRMKADDGKIIPPGAFLPAAERYNKIINIDRWVVAESFSTLSENPEFLNKIDYCSINLSCQSLTDTKFLNFIIDQFSIHEGLAEKICFEITETSAIINLLHANRYISILRGMGLRFALDDFGSGLSSFAYLKTLPVDYLKIDGMFVRDIASDPIDRAMVKSIHEIGSLMGKQTIAEFVEDGEILAHLKTIGVNYAQGYETGKPKPIQDVIDEVTNMSSQLNVAVGK